MVHDRVGYLPCFGQVQALPRHRPSAGIRSPAQAPECRRRHSGRSADPPRKMALENAISDSCGSGSATQPRAWEPAAGYSSRMLSSPRGRSRPRVATALTWPSKKLVAAAAGRRPPRVAPPDDRADRLLAAPGRLVEHDQVERLRIGLEVLGHRQRAHHHARLHRPALTPARWWRRPRQRSSQPRLLRGVDQPHESEAHRSLFLVRRRPPSTRPTFLHLPAPPREGCPAGEPPTAWWPCLRARTQERVASISRTDGWSFLQSQLGCGSGATRRCVPCSSGHLTPSGR